jgi:hypothetical protein
VPNIKNAWAMPTVDIDAVLIAIRVATYGEGLDVEITVPNTDIVKSYTADLRLTMDRLMGAVFDTELQIADDMTVYLRPLTYKEYTQNSLKTLEEQRMYSIVNDAELSDEDKQKRFSESFKKITDVTVNSIVQSIVSINTPDAVVTDPEHIREFLDNSDKIFFEKLVAYLREQREKFTMPPFKVQTTEEEQAEGAPAEFDAPIVLDASNFFG